MNTTAALLRYAEQVLDGTVAVERARASRAAAFLVRQALEEIVLERCRGLGLNLERASMRSRLIILRELDDREAGEKAASAWNDLSHACHHHAYELAPTASEVRHWCGVVAGLLQYR